MDRKNRILIITDSISIPRPGIRYEDTWIYNFKKRFPRCDIIDRPMRGGTTSRLVTEGGGGADLLEFYMPGIVILQMGYAECAPRLFKKKGIEHYFMHSILPASLLGRYISFIKKRRIRTPDRTDIDPAVTESNIRNFIERCAACGTTLICLKIHRAGSFYISKSPFIQQNVDAFNGMLERFSREYSHVRLVEPISDKYEMDSLCIDELHVNARGHRLYYNALSDAVRRLL
ncbi:MAG: hypothetical protein GXY14_03250 [Spirochaetes bacterium]|nr:hypothetical protein [Spirochaetota bacterium]